jgi:hypothetical protein
MMTMRVTLAFIRNSEIVKSPNNSARSKTVTLCSATRTHLGERVLSPPGAGLSTVESCVTVDYGSVRADFPQCAVHDAALAGQDGVGSSKSIVCGLPSVRGDFDPSSFTADRSAPTLLMRCWIPASPRRYRSAHSVMCRPCRPRPRIRRFC